MASDRTERRGGTVPGSVALFIDWDNFAIGLRQEMPDRPADVGPILRWSRRFGVLSVCRAYGEWRDPSERLAIYNAGVEVVYAPVLPLGGSVQARAGSGGAKSLADTAMAVDVTDALNLMPSITTVILATSDKDLIPVLRFAQRRGLHAVVVGSDRTAGALRELADEFISYRQLLDFESPTATQSRPAMVPPVRYSRAPRTGVVVGPVAALLPPAAPVRRGRFEPRSVVVPRVPVAATAMSAASASSAVSGNGDTSPVAPDGTSPGSVFVDGPDEIGGDAAARRRRRGGRRRRGREVTGDAAAGANPESDSSDEDSDPGHEPIEDAVAIGAGDLAARGPTAVERASALKEPEEPRTTALPAIGVRRRPDASSPAAGRGPVVLPGERLRRLATQPAAEAAPRAAAANESEGTTQPADAEPAGPSGAEASDEKPASSPGVRRGGRGRGRASKSAAGTDDGATSSEETASEPTTPVGNEPQAGGEHAADTAAAPGPDRGAVRGRRRGARAR